MTTFEDTVDILEEIRKYDDLRAFQKERSKDLCEKFSINQSQLDFLISVIASERIKKNKVL